MGAEILEYARVATEAGGGPARSSSRRASKGPGAWFVLIKGHLESSAATMSLAVLAEPGVAVTAKWSLAELDRPNTDNGARRSRFDDLPVDDCRDRS